MNGQNFDPYLDFDQMTGEMVDDLHGCIADFEAVKQEFIANKNPALAQKIIEQQIRIAATINAIRQTLIVQPVMVHIAGERIEETDEEGHETVVQRCKRCASTLQFWHEGMAVFTPAGPHRLEVEEVPWWSDGTQVAKSTDPDGMTMYEIENGEKLEKWQLPCLDLTELIGP